MGKIEVAEALAELSALKDLSGGNPFSAKAYSNASKVLREYPGSLELFVNDSIAGIGPKIKSTIIEIASTGTTVELTELRAKFPPVGDLTKVPGIGWKKALKLNEKYGITNRKQLRDLLEANKFEGTEESNSRLLAAVIFSDNVGQRIPRAVVAPRVERILAEIQPFCEEVHTAGSFRRMAETVKDVDLLAVSKKASKLLKRFRELGELVVGEADQQQKCSIFYADGAIRFRVDLLIVDPAEIGAALLYFTGSKELNISMRALARAKNWTLNEHGLFDKKGQPVADARTEHALFAALDLPYHSPQLRDGAALTADQMRNTVKKVRVDLHTHTKFSDGVSSPRAMVERAIKRGLEVLAITDHVARGVYGLQLFNSASLQKQWFAEIDELKAQYKDQILLLTGAEADVNAKGEILLPHGFAERCDLLVASCHTNPNHRLEERWVRMLEQRPKRWPKVRVIGHPTGRALGSRPAGEADWNAVFAECARQDVAIEVNGQPSRLDLPESLIGLAVKAGCMLVCVSDAHSASGLSALTNARVVVQRARVNKRRVLRRRSDVERWLSQ